MAVTDQSDPHGTTPPITNPGRPVIKAYGMGNMAPGTITRNLYAP
jgi:hypothetical protein